MARTTHNPFLMSEAKIEDEVCFTDRCSSHETYDSSSLLNIAENIISQANHVVDNHVLSMNPTPVEHLDVNFQANNFDPKFSTLKHLACQMHSMPLSEVSAHKTTIGILENLATFSWASKAVLSLAAFANDYGGFWHLVQSPMTDTLAKSLGILNRVPAIVSPLALTRHKRAITEISEMVKSLLDMVKCITEMESLFATYNKYDEEDMPLLYQGMKHIPLDTYWTLLSIVACSCQMADPEYKYQLNRYDQKLQSILSQIKDRLDHIKGSLPSPLPPNPTDIVEFLKALIFHPMHIEHPNVFDGSTTKMVSIEVLSKKNVFLFISGLERIEDDIMRLSPIHEAITKEKDKKDYKIMWLPMVDQWNDKERAKFESLKKKMSWYVVEYFSPVKHRKHIMEKWQYMNKPIVVVLGSKGNVVNTNAMPMIFSWGIKAFPFHDDAHICEHWNWLWFKVSKYFPQHIQKWIDDTKYIFLYGGHDNLWVDKFTKQLKVIREDPKIKQADCEIEMFYLGKDDTNIVTSFWGDINELFAAHIHKKRDPVIEDVEKFLSFKGETGWALLAKGRNVVDWDYIDVMFKVVVEEFDKWKDQVAMKGFDVAFVDCHKEIEKRPNVPKHCAHLQYENVRSKVPENLKCPDCHHMMEIASVNYRCCHGGHAHPVAAVSAAADAHDVRAY